MSDVAKNLTAKLEAAGLTAEEKLVLAVAIGAPHAEAEVEGFASPVERIAFNLGMPPTKGLGNFEIQDLMSRFNQAETLAAGYNQNEQLGRG